MIHPPPATKTAINQIDMLINHAATAPNTTIAEIAMIRAPEADMFELGSESNIENHRRICGQSRIRIRKSKFDSDPNLREGCS